MYLSDVDDMEKNIVPKAQIHKMNFDSIVKRRGVCIFGSNGPFSFHLRAAREQAVLLLSQFKGVPRNSVSEK